METRMKHPVFVVPEALQALHALGKAVHKTGLSPQLIELVNLRASQINGCSVCVEMHSRSLKAAGESDERIWSVGAWRETPYYDEAERAALALAEAATRICDRADPVPDEIWDNAANHLKPELSVAIASQQTIATDRTGVS